MRMHYRYGWPMGRLFARLGVPTKILFNVIKDEEAGVFVGTSPDIRGLIVEAETFEALVHEARPTDPRISRPIPFLTSTSEIGSPMHEWL